MVCHHPVRGLCLSLISVYGLSPPCTIVLCLTVISVYGLSPPCTRVLCLSVLTNSVRVSTTCIKCKGFVSVQGHSLSLTCFIVRIQFLVNDIESQSFSVRVFATMFLSQCKDIH